MEIVYLKSTEGVNWEQLKSALTTDNFDNGRTVEELASSFGNSAVTVYACAENRVIGTARALSDGVCNAYVVDVWTHSKYRRHGIARTMMKLLIEPLSGQHVYLFTDDAVSFYENIGYQRRGVGFGTVVGRWLNRA